MIEFPLDQSPRPTLPANWGQEKHNITEMTTASLFEEAFTTIEIELEVELELLEEVTLRARKQKSSSCLHHVSIGVIMAIMAL